MSDSSDSDESSGRFGATEETKKFNGSPFPKLSSDHVELDTQYDVIVVGSGYGASIAASRCARSGQKLCVLERGKEWLPGSFPESMSDGGKNFQIDILGKPEIFGDPTDLYEAVVSKDITVVQGCGLGGTSLINANVALDTDKRVFESSVWPKEIKKDMDVIMNVDRKKYQEMMQWMEYPDSFPKLKKIEAMKKCATAFSDSEDIEEIFKKTPLYVNFERKKSDDFRFDQPPCNACGNCVTGCNTGAKNTLNMNYLPDAKVHGAKIFTEISVVSVEKPESSKLWKVYYKRYSDGKPVNDREECLLANIVILGGGSLGSTKILLKSKQRGLKISEMIGSRFTGNGDTLGFSYLGDDVVNCFGLESGKYERIKENSPGPCITSVIDLRSLPNKPYKEGMVIEDGSPPGATAKLVEKLLLVASQAMGVRTFSLSDSKRRAFEKLKDLLKDEEMEKTLMWLVMSHDDASGRIKLHERMNGNDGAYIEWEDVGHQKNFEMVNKNLLKCAEKLGGYYIKNPVWSELLDKQLVTVHPLGGCPMAENGNTGVVNHKGQVFSGKDEDVHEGLYVMDGSIIPCSVGVNPTMTIGILSERCCRLLIRDKGWTFDESVKDFKTLCP